MSVCEPIFTGLSAYQSPRRNRISSSRAITPSIRMTPTFCGLIRIAKRVNAAMKMAAGSRIGGVRSGRTGGRGLGGPGGSCSDIHVVDEPQTFEHQTLIDQLDNGSLSGDQPGKTTGRDHTRLLTQFLPDAVDHPFHLGRESEDDARLHALGRGTADHG